MDNGHKLLGERTDFAEVRAALDALKNDRNELVGHEGSVTCAEYEQAVANIHAFLDACVDKHALFSAAWKHHLEDAVAIACKATWTVNDLEIVCRSAKDYVDRSRCEAKTLFHAQVNIDAHVTLSFTLVFLCNRALSATVFSLSYMYMINTSVTVVRLSHTLGDLSAGQAAAEHHCPDGQGTTTTRDPGA